MKVYVIEKDYGGHDCWGRSEYDWKKTNIIFTDEDKAKEYIKTNGNDYNRYVTIETR